MNKKCCVAIISYKEKLIGTDEQSFEQALKVFNGKRDIKIIFPNNLSYDYYQKYREKYSFEIVKVKHEWMDNYQAHNMMCTDKKFYELFKDYDYVLKYETDAWVFEDRLDEFIKLGYDWYGAPWPIYNNQVGNGDLSLRKVDKMIELTTKYTYNGRINEDGWFCLTHKKDLNICDLDNACNFSMEIISPDYLPKIKTYPMGLHSSRVFQFWDEDGTKFMEYKKKELNRKVSIITVNLNNNEGLKKTIESVVNQTSFENIEYIVIDGGSTDGSLEIIEKYKDKLSYYVSEKDNGIYDGMNKGIRIATGDYCLFLNSGDYLWENNVIERILPQLTEDIVYGDLMLNGKTRKIYQNKIDVEYFGYESLPHPASFIRAKYLKENEYDTNYKIISDWIFFRKSIAIGRTYKHVDIIVSDFQLGGTSSNVKKVNKEKEKYFKEPKKYDHEISVVIPCYNQGKYIKETIDSLKKSIYEDFHCIIVNDGSTDNSEKVILKEIDGDNRFEYFSNENHGLSYTRNFGINKTNSKYILCLDSDDKISSAYIECAVRYLNSHPDTSVFYGNAIMFYDNGNMAFWNLPKFSYSSLLDINSIYCSCVYRRKDYERVGGYDELMKSGYEDWEFLIRLLYNNDNVYRTDDIVFYYRRHDDSMDVNTRKNAKEIKEYIKNKNKKLFNITEKQNVPIILIKCNDKDNFYGNLSDLKNIDENILKDEKYVAVYQNGKRFNFPNEAPTVDEVFSKYDSVVAKPLVLKTTIKEQYAMNHNIEDFEIIEKIIADKYPSYVNSWHNFINGNIFVPYNMFIMKKDDFKKYIEFIFGVLDEYIKIVGTDINKRIEDNKDKYIKDFYPNNTVEYQYRIGGYAGERLSNVFFMNNFKLMKTYPVIITEDKYKK